MKKSLLIGGLALLSTMINGTAQASYSNNNWSEESNNSQINQMDPCKEIQKICFDKAQFTSHNETCVLNFIQQTNNLKDTSLQSLKKKAYTACVYLKDLFYIKNISSKRSFRERQFQAIRTYLNKLSSQKQFDPFISFQLAEFYEKGKGTQINLKNALKVYKIAAREGSAEAAQRLGLFYVRGKKGMLEKDLSTGIKYLERALELGSSKASFNLGYVLHTFVKGSSREEETQIINKAIQAYQKTPKTEPLLYVKAQVFAANLLASQKKYKEAAGCLKLITSKESLDIVSQDGSGSGKSVNNILINLPSNLVEKLKKLELYTEAYHLLKLQKKVVKRSNASARNGIEEIDRQLKSLYPKAINFSETEEFKTVTQKIDMFKLNLFSSKPLKSILVSMKNEDAIKLLQNTLKLDADTEISKSLKASDMSLLHVASTLKKLSEKDCASRISNLIKDTKEICKHLKDEDSWNFFKLYFNPNVTKPQNLITFIKKYREKAYKSGVREKLSIYSLIKHMKKNLSILNEIENFSDIDTLVNMIVQYSHDGLEETALDYILPIPVKTLQLAEDTAKKIVDLSCWDTKRSKYEDFLSCMSLLRYENKESMAFLVENTQKLIALRNKGLDQAHYLRDGFTKKRIFFSLGQENIKNRPQAIQWIQKFYQYISFETLMALFNEFSFESRAWLIEEADFKYLKPPTKEDIGLGKYYSNFLRQLSNKSLEDIKETVKILGTYHGSLKGIDDYINYRPIREINEICAKDTPWLKSYCLTIDKIRKTLKYSIDSAMPWTVEKLKTLKAAQIEKVSNPTIELVQNLKVKKSRFFKDSKPFNDSNFSKIIEVMATASPKGRYDAVNDLFKKDTLLNGKEVDRAERVLFYVKNKTGQLTDVNMIYDNVKKFGKFLKFTKTGCDKNYWMGGYEKWIDDRIYDHQVFLKYTRKLVKIGAVKQFKELTNYSLSTFLMSLNEEEETYYAQCLGLTNIVTQEKWKAGSWRKYYITKAHCEKVPFMRLCNKIFNVDVGPSNDEHNRHSVPEFYWDDVNRDIETYEKKKIEKTLNRNSSNLESNPFEDQGFDGEKLLKACQPLYDAFIQSHEVLFQLSVNQTRDYCKLHLSRDFANVKTYSKLKDMYFTAQSNIFNNKLESIGEDSWEGMETLRQLDRMIPAVNQVIENDLCFIPISKKIYDKYNIFSYSKNGKKVQKHPIYSARVELYKYFGGHFMSVGKENNKLCRHLIDTELTVYNLEKKWLEILKLKNRPIEYDVMYKNLSKVFQHTGKIKRHNFLVDETYNKRAAAYLLQEDKDTL